MRMALVLLIACSAKQPPPDVKAPGNLPVMTAAELAAYDAKRAECVEACDEVDDGEACRVECDESFPPMQVEVIPDPPMAEEAG